MLEVLGVSLLLTSKRGLIGITSARFLTAGLVLPLAEIAAAALLVLTGALELPAPAEVFLLGFSLKGSPSASLRPEDQLFCFGFHSGPTSSGDLKGCHPQHPLRVEGVNTIGCCLVPQGDHS
jgi:hypothetical protein